ncbi:MAG TPA: ABC transporter substrate-binding protein [Solirubrobacterales bacterium]
MRSRLTALLAALAIIAVGGFIAGCGDDDDDDGTTTAAGGDLGLIEEGQLFVGTDTPYKPFEIGQPPDISGYDIDVLNEIANRVGLSVTYQDTPFDTIFRDLAQGKFDATAAATTITPEREQKVDFTDPYYGTDQALVVLPDSDIAAVDDLGGTTVGAQSGTTGEEYAEDETDASDVRGYPEGPDAINALKAGQVDAVVIDQGVADAAVAAGGVKVATVIPTGEFYGFALQEDSDALREQMNEALKAMKEDGALNDLYQKYFQQDAPESVLTGTNQDLQ